MTSTLVPELIPSPFNSTCFYYRGICNQSECQDFIKRIDNPLKINTTSEEITRIVERTRVKDEDLAVALFDRIAPLCPPTWQVSHEDENLGPFSQGIWELDSVDPRIQIYKYESGGIFKKHRDGCTLYSADKRSFFTTLIYLNEEFSGGHTTVFTEDQSQLYAVPYSTGGVFVMLQSLLHEGSKVESGTKYALRCDVLYRRIGGSVDDVMRPLSKKEQAKKWFQLASAIELSGLQNESLTYYQRAYKLDPELDG